MYKHALFIAPSALGFSFFGWLQQCQHITVASPAVRPENHRKPWPPQSFLLTMLLLYENDFFWGLRYFLGVDTCKLHFPCSEHLWIYIESSLSSKSGTGKVDLDSHLQLFKKTHHCKQQSCLFWAQSLSLLYKVTYFVFAHKLCLISSTLAVIFMEDSIFFEFLG